jgi:hypothetical protein
MPMSDARGDMKPPGWMIWVIASGLVMYFTHAFAASGSCAPSKTLKPAEVP